ncbi:MAG: hypothetical protein H0W72_16965 [Planctomycetes bacterium]|nr:hypothetical protein [Planctomycetota bacterium]
MPRILSDADIQRFMTVGHVKVPQAFPAEAALAAQDFLWGKLVERGVDRTDPTTWRKPMEFIAENYNTPPFDACATRRLSAACVDLLGDGRWFAEQDTGWWGWWPINFSVGADKPWDVPCDEWHFDSQDHATFVDSNDQGLLVICLLSEIKPRGGGTLVVDGSHRVVSRFFRDHPGIKQLDGIPKLNGTHPFLRALTCAGEPRDAVPATDSSKSDGGFGGRPVHFPGNETTPRIERFMRQEWSDGEDVMRVSEITGSPGDVFLCHPFMIHSPSFNHSGAPRFMCNRKAPLLEKLQLERADGAYSPLEESIRRALATGATAARVD